MDIAALAQRSQLLKSINQLRKIWKELAIASILYVHFQRVKTRCFVERLIINHYPVQLLEQAKVQKSSWELMEHLTHSF